MGDRTGEQHPDLEAAAVGAPARLPRCPLPSRSHQEDSKLVLSSGSRGYLNPPWGPASPGAQRLADTSLAPPAEAGRWARFPGLEPGALSLRHASPSASPASPQPSAPARRLPPAPPRRGHQSRAPVRPSRPPQDVGTGERAARPAGAGRRAGAKPRVGRLGREGSQGLQARPLTRGLWGSPWTRARPGRIHA